MGNKVFVQAKCLHCKSCIRLLLPMLCRKHSMAPNTCCRRMKHVPYAQENVDLMTQYLPLDAFKAIYVVDLCKSLCAEARKKVEAKGWTNVHVIEGDACTFVPPGPPATLVTFSYSLSSEPLTYKTPLSTRVH